jgi:hypothetical protein
MEALRPAPPPGPLDRCQHYEEDRGLAVAVNRRSFTGGSATLHARMTRRDPVSPPARPALKRSSRRAERAAYARG